MGISVNLPTYGNLFFVGSSFDDLRSVSTLKINESDTALVKGRSASGDGLGGTFVYQPGSTAADDNFTTLAPSDGQPGRWQRIPGPIGAQGAPGAPGANVMAVALFAALSTGTIISSGTARVDTTGHTSVGRGTASYVADTNLNSAFVTANPKWSFQCVDENGATRYFRLAPQGAVTLEQFGGAGDSGIVGAIGTDNITAWNALTDFLEYDKRNVSSTFYKGGREVHFPGACYYFSQTLNLKRTYTLTGMGAGQPGGEATALRFPAGVGGIIVNSYDTSLDGADTGPAGQQVSASATVIRNLLIQGGGGTVASSLQDAALKSGVWLRQRASLHNVLIRNFAGCGFLNTASTTVNNPDFRHGNANTWCYIGGRVEQNKFSGFYVEAADSNAGTAIAIDCSNNGGWGFYDNSFLGNTYLGCHADSNGWLGSAGTTNTTSIVSDGTYRYGLFNGQDASGATTAPTTNGSNSVWRLLGTGSTSSQIPLYATTLNFKSGGSYCHVNLNAKTFYGGCYEETGQNPSQIKGSAMWMGGFNPNSFGTPGLTDGAPIVFGTQGGGLGTQVGYFAKSQIGGSGAGQLTVGIGGGHSLGTIVTATNSASAPSTWRINLDPAKGDIVFNYANGAEPLRLTGPNSTYQFGRDAAVPYTPIMPNGFSFGSPGQARIWLMGTAAPTTGYHGKGERVWNNGDVTSLDTTSYWVCTAAGTPGTWSAKA